MYIYKITNIINGKVYIGKTTKTIQQRFNKHIQDAFNALRKTKICNAIRKYGKSNFIIEEICECNNKEELNEKEKFYIKFYNSNVNGYNISDGGDGGYTIYHTNEVQKKIMKERKGKTYEEIYGEERAKEIKEKISIAEKGKKVSDETKEKISNKSKQWWKNNYEKGVENNRRISKRGVNHFMFGKTHTQEAREKISKSKKGKTYEEIYGEEAKKIKERNHKMMLGENNPSYKNINIIQILNVLIEQPYIRLKELAKMFNLSSPTMSNKLKKYLKIDNLQVFRKKDKNELINIFRSIKDNVK